MLQGSACNRWQKAGGVAWEDSGSKCWDAGGGGCLGQETACPLCGGGNACWQSCPIGHRGVCKACKFGGLPTCCHWVPTQHACHYQLGKGLACHRISGGYSGSLGGWLHSLEYPVCMTATTTATARQLQWAPCWQRGKGVGWPFLGCLPCPLGCQGEAIGPVHVPPIQAPPGHWLLPPPPFSCSEGSGR